MAPISLVQVVISLATAQGPEGITSVCSSSFLVLSALGGAWLGTWSGGRDSPAVLTRVLEDSQKPILGLLRSQLDRCGPEHLNLQPPPACPEPVCFCPDIGVPVCLAFVAGTLVGALAVAYCVRRAAGPAPARVEVAALNTERPAPELRGEVLA